MHCFSEDVLFSTCYLIHRLQYSISFPLSSMIIMKKIRWMLRISVKYSRTSRHFFFFATFFDAGFLTFVVLVFVVAAFFFTGAFFLAGAFFTVLAFAAWA